MTPPPRSVLKEMLEELAEDEELNLGMDLDHMPDRAWMIIALGTLNPEHAIFEKSYQPQVAKKQMQSTQISNADDYFTGLPKLSKLADLKGKAGACFTKEEKLQIRMEREKEKMRKCNERLDRISEEMKDVHEPSMSKRALKLKMEEMEALIDREQEERRAQELQMAELMAELQRQQQYAENARSFYDS